MFQRARAVGSVFRGAFANPALRRVGIAYALFGAAEYGVWIALLVFAYAHGGTRASTLMVLVQLAPCIVLGPLLGSAADRHAPGRVLWISYGLQAVSMAAVAAAVGLGAPPALVFALAPLAAIAMTVTRPAQAALLPAVARTPDELTAANVMSGWCYGAAALVGPAVVGVFLAWRGLTLAVVATAAMSVVATVLVIGVHGPAAAVLVADDEDEDQGEAAEAEADGAEAGSWLRRARAAVGDTTRNTLGVAMAIPSIRALLVLHAFYFVLIGAADVLCVVLATSYLHMGAGGPGFLNAALGAGALLAGLVTAFLVGRRHLQNTLTAFLSVAVLALALVDSAARVGVVMVLMGIVGLAGTVFDVTSRTLLQRAAPPDAIAASFSILEAMMDLGVLLGAVLVQVAMAAGGLRAALLAPAVVAFVLIALLWRRLRGIDATATVPQVEIQLLRGNPIFAALSPPVLEGVARELELVSVPAGTTVIREGDQGDRYYAVASGELVVTRQGRLLQRVARGGGFGEIALIRDLPRQATVTAVTDADLFALRKELFVPTVTGHQAAGSAAGRIVAGHMGAESTGAPLLPEVTD